jgi:hypothetical protein
MLQIKVLEEIKMHILCSIAFSPENGTVLRATHDNMIKATDKHAEYVILDVFP